MKVSELKNKLNLTLLTDDKFEDREISGCYIGDLLSWVMSHAQPDNVWITIMSNVNITAVAALVDVACIVLAEGTKLDDGVVEKANSAGVIILSSEKSAYELANALSNGE